VPTDSNLLETSVNRLDASLKDVMPATRVSAFIALMDMTFMTESVINVENRIAMTSTCYIFQLVAQRASATIQASVIAMAHTELMKMNVEYAAWVVQIARSTPLDDLFVMNVTKDTLKLMICHTCVLSYKMTQ